MKVLHVIPSLATGGAEKLIIETVPLINEKGLISDVLIFNEKDYPFFKILREKNCCQIFSLGKYSVYNPLLIFKIIPFLRKYDVIHTHLFSAQYFTAIAKIISFSNTNLVFTEHSTSNRRFKNKWFKIFDLLVYSVYTKIIAISNEVKQSVIDHANVDEDKIEVILNGINLQNIHNALPIDRSSIFSGINDKDILVMQVSSFQFPKDQSTLIRSLRLLPESVKLWLVGDGMDKPKVQALVNELYLGHRVLFLGIRNDIPQLLKTADIIVLSSKYEGLSLSSIEGMASEKPFVASDVPGLKDIVEGAGLLFPQGDDSKLAEIIQDLIDDKDLYNLVASRCIERAKLYDINKMVDQTIDLYKSIV